MDKKRNPIYRSGSRNVFCSYYPDCLDEAAKKSWEFWDCGQCVNNALYNPAFEMSNTVSDTVVYYDLPSEILENVLEEI